LSYSNLNKFNTPYFPGALDGTPFNAVTEEDLGRNAQMISDRILVLAPQTAGFSNSPVAPIDLTALALRWLMPAA
jgi:hypothetical protein